MINGFLIGVFLINEIETLLNHRHDHGDTLENTNILHNGMII